MEECLRRAANVIRKAEAMIVTAGAGMGVDSGLPDFRGEKGFWNAYPPYEKLGLNFTSMADPVHFKKDPPFGWGFYGHRLELYRNTVPHKGFGLLLQWADRFQLPYFVVTSNVDGQFQKAGVPENRIYEIHGSIHYNQCSTPCEEQIWPNKESVPVDIQTMRAGHIPQCPFCKGVARPNILMFGDWSYIPLRGEQQSESLDSFLEQYKYKPKAIVEIGAGTHVPSIRMMSERLGRSPQNTVLRINPRESEIDTPHISLSGNALWIIERLDAFLK